MHCFIVSLAGNELSQNAVFGAEHGRKRDAQDIIDVGKRGGIEGG